MQVNLHAKVVQKLQHMTLPERVTGKATCDFLFTLSNNRDSHLEFYKMAI